MLLLAGRRENDIMGTSIYVVSHKPFDQKQYHLDPCYQVIRVGKYSKEENAVGISDATGENIAAKNPNYCELTAHYWIWKNDSKSDVKGLCHYRRYFTSAKVSANSKHILGEKDIDSLLQKYDAIIPLDQSYICGAYKKYLGCGFKKDLDITKEAIKTLTPEYLEYYEKDFENSASFCLGNMLIAKKEVFDAYSEWLFKILDYVEMHTDLTGYTTQEARIYGYISERLLKVWFNANHIKYTTMRVINTEDHHGVKFYAKEILKTGGIYDFIKKMIFKFRR